MVKKTTGAQAVLWNPILSAWNLKAMTLAMFQQIRIECFDVSKIGFQTHGTTAVGLAAAKMASSCAGVSVFKVQTWPRYRRYRHWLGVDGNVIRYAVMGWPTP